MSSEKNDSIKFFVVICAILLIEWAMLLAIIPDDNYYSGGALTNGAYILKSDPTTYLSERYFTPKEIMSVMLVSIENPEEKPFAYATSDKTKIPEGLKKGDIVFKNENGLNKIEMRIEK